MDAAAHTSTGDGLTLGFATADGPTAEAARLVYAIWRSRDVSRLRISPSIWGQVERQVKSCAKRAASLPEMAERLKPRFQTEAIRLDLLPPDALASPNAAAILRACYRETGYVVVLVRERLQRERGERELVDHAERKELP